MLQVSFLREEKERVLEGLKKRNFKQLELVDEAIQLDDERKKTQQELDSQLAEINKISKEIGILMKEGKKEENVQGALNGGRKDDLFGMNQDLNDDRLNQMKDKEDEEDAFSGFYNYQIPWDINMALSVTYNNSDFGRKISTCSLMMSANTDLTPKWKFGVSTGYDFINKGVTFTQIRMNRDLMSWYMNFNWSPFGQNSYWGFFIGIKAGVLSDIKWDKRTQPDRVLR